MKFDEERDVKTGAWCKHSRTCFLFKDLSFLV